MALVPGEAALTGSAVGAIVGTFNTGLLRASLTATATIAAVGTFDTGLLQASLSASATIVPAGASSQDHVRWFLSGGSGNTDPDASLGNARSTSTELHEFQSQLTATQGGATERYIYTDAGRSGDGDDEHVGKWLLMINGSSALSAGRIMDFDSATGTFFVDRNGSANAAAGDVYQVFSSGNLFDDVSAVESSQGVVDHRMLYCRNESGVTLTPAADVKWSFIALDEGPVAFDFVPGRVAGDATGALSSDTESPFSNTGFVDTPSSGFNQSPAPGLGSQGVPAQGISAVFTNNTHIPIWLRRTVPADSEVRRRCAIQLILTTPVTGQDPDPLVASCIIAFEVEGYTPSLTLSHDRFPHVGGGARFSSTLTATESSAAVGGREVSMEVTAGQGSIVADDTQTDDDGLLEGTYTSPTDPAQEGQNATITVQVGDGEEVL
jgi:hypothetical protein